MATNLDNFINGKSSRLIVNEYVKRTTIDDSFFIAFVIFSTYNAKDPGLPVYFLLNFLPVGSGVNHKERDRVCSRCL